MNYKLIDLNSSKPATCQCGAPLLYDENTNSLVCQNPNCIKKRLKSVLCTLHALDRLAINNGYDYKLVELAKANCDILETFVDSCDIRHGIELITKGLDLRALCELGQCLENIIDNFEFTLSDLSSLCGSRILAQLNIDFSILPRNDKRLAIAKINEQLGIDGSVLLATLIYEDFEMYYDSIIELTEYITLYRPSTKKRSTTPIKLNIPEDIDYAKSLITEANNTNVIESIIQQPTKQIIPELKSDSDNDEDSDAEDTNNNLMEELFEW